MALQELVGREYDGEYVCAFTTRPGTPEAVLNPTTHLTFSYATQVVILDDQGRIERVVAAHDVGRAINPRLCAEQMEGGVHMGLGYALSENFPSTGGVPHSLALRDLGIVPAKHMPDVDVILIEVPDEVGGYGAKGVGEIGCVATARAVAGCPACLRRDPPLPAADGRRPRSAAVCPQIPTAKVEKQAGFARDHRGLAGLRSRVWRVPFTFLPDCGPSVDMVPSRGAGCVLPGRTARGCSGERRPGFPGKTMKAFDFVAARDARHAVALLAERAPTAKVKVLAGGTDLLADLKFAPPSHAPDVVSTSRERMT